MFSVYPFSTAPFSDSAQNPRIYFQIDITSIVDLTFLVTVATEEFATAPTDALSNRVFKGRLERYSLSRGILGSEIDPFINVEGTIDIKNIDGYYDFLPQDYTMDARPVRAKVFRRGDSYDTAYQFATITANSFDVDTKTLTANVVDYGYKLDVPLQPNLYAGTGGKEGGADLENKRKVRCFGPAKTVPAPMVDANLLIFHVNDGPVQDITAVHVRGVALTKGSDYASYAALEAATITAGDFATCKAEGFFRLQFLTADDIGAVTANVEGDNSDGYVTTHADLVRWAIRNATSISDPDGLDVASFAAFNTAETSSADYWLGPDDTISVADFVTNMMRGAFGWAGFRRNGLFGVWLAVPPAGEPIASFDEDDLLKDDLSRTKLNIQRPPAWRWQVMCERSWTVQTDLAGGVTDAQRTFVSQEYRLGSAENEAVKIDHPFAVDKEPVQAFYSLKAGSDACALRRLDFYKASRYVYSFSIPRRGLRRDIGDVIRLTHNRLGLSSGKLMLILKLDELVDRSGDGIEMVKIYAIG